MTVAVGATRDVGQREQGFLRWADVCPPQPTADAPISQCGEHGPVVAIAGRSARFEDHGSDVALLEFPDESFQASTAPTLRSRHCAFVADDDDLHGVPQKVEP